MKRSILPLLLAVATLTSSLEAAPARVTRIKANQLSSEQLQAHRHDGNSIFLNAGVFDPTTEQIDFSEAGFTSGVGSEYGIVQFRQGQTAAREQLEKMGVEFFGYLPDNAFQVRLSGNARALLQSHQSVRWVGAYEPGYKVSPRLWAKSSDRNVEITLVGFPDVSIEKITTTLLKEFSDARVRHYGNDPGFEIAIVAVPIYDRSKFVRRAAETDGISWIEPFIAPEFHNDSASGVIQNGVIGEPGRTIFNRDIIGTGQIVAIADSGVDSDSCFFRNLNGVNEVTDATRTTAPAPGPLFPNRKVIGYWVQEGADPYDNNNSCQDVPNSYHGTHTAGSVAGDNFANPSSPTDPGVNTGDGMAPNAQLLVQDIGNEGGCLSFVDRTLLMQQARAGGARVHSNSYGSETEGSYTTSDQTIDRFLFSNDEMTILFSVGNNGPGGVTGGSPGNAKNVITVGALGAGDSTTAATFSSRGLTADGRIKPDIMAPGVAVNSALGDDSHDSNNCGTQNLQGTSMSTPIVAGGSALVRQYFADGFYPTGQRNAADSWNLAAPTVKAVLLNGTLPLPVGGRFGNERFGWGRIFLESNLFFPGDPRKLRVWTVRNVDGMTTGQSHSYSVQVAAGQEFRATLVWVDPDASLNAASTLVNNLDLAVFDGTNTYLGNVRNDTGDNITGGSADSVNNIEQVRLTAPAAGTYTVRVLGTNVPGSLQRLTQRQGYALAVSFGTCNTTVSGAPTSLSAVSHPTMGATLSWTPAASSSVTQVYRANGTCASAAAGDFQFVGSNAGGAFTDTRAQGGTTYSYKVRGADGCGEGPVSSCVTVTPTGGCDVPPVFNGLTAAEPDGANCRINLRWSPATSACPLGTGVRYNVYRGTDPSFLPTTPIATVTGTTYSDTAIVGNTTYYYIVRADDAVSSTAARNEDPNLFRFSATAVGPPGATGTWRDDAGDTNAYLSLQEPWRITAGVAQSGSRAYRTGFESRHPALVCAAATTPPLVIEAGAELSYFARFNLEFQWDGVIVEISTDGGTTWSDLPPNGGYPSTLAETGNPPVNQCGYAASHGAFTGPPANPGLTEWTEYKSSLASFAGQTIRVRWRFTTDPSAEFEGFFLDTISITNVKLPGACVAVAIRPVPQFSFTPGAPVPGTPVTFRDESTNTPTSWLWNFGDGSTSILQNPTHVYAAPGRYVVTLTATNAVGSNVTTREITVLDPATVFTPQLIVPGQARAQGSGGSLFKTAFWMTNTTDAETIVRLRFNPAAGQTLGGAQETVAVTIPARRSVAYRDVLHEAFGATSNTTGVILVEVAQGKATPIVTSRTFNDAGTAGTFGQYIPAVPLVGSGVTTTSIEGLGGDARSRTNVGVVNLTEAPIAATISVFDAAGVKRGNDIVLTIPARTMLQQGSVNVVAGAGELSVFSVRITGTGLFFAYGSKLDNTTSDPIFIPSTLTPKALQWIDGVAAVTGAGGTVFRSNFAVSNRGSAPVNVNVALTRRGEIAPSSSVTIPLAANSTRFINDLLQETFNTQAVGTLRITTDTGAPVVAWARTFSDRGTAGTLGQFIPGFGAEDLIPAGGAILQGVSENAGFRTNMGLINTSGASVTVDVAVWRNDGIKVGENEYTLAGGSAISVNQVIKAITPPGTELSDAYLTITPSVGGAIYAWASFVDNVSTDQTFVRPINLP